MKTLITTSLLASLAPVAAAAAPADGQGNDHPSGFGALVEPFVDPATNAAALALATFLAIVIFAGAFKTIGRMLDDRSAKIGQQLEEARALREEASHKLAEAERKQKEADAAAEGIVQQARADAAAMVEQARADLKEKVARREAQAEQRIARAEADATEEVRRAAADAATQAAREVLASSGKDRELFDKALSDVERALN